MRSASSLSFANFGGLEAYPTSLFTRFAIKDYDFPIVCA